MKGLAVSVIASLLSLVGARAEGLAEVTELAVGQKWSYAGGAETSHFVIGRIETVGGEEVVSISLFRPDADAVVRDDGQTFPMTEFGHLPFSSDVIRRDAKRLLEEDAELSDMFESGYEQWRDAVREGGAGWFDAPIVQVAGR